MKTIVCIFFPFILSFSLLGQNSGSLKTAEEPVLNESITDTSQQSHSFNINPIGILLGGTGVTYEYLLDGKNGLLIEGGYAFSNGYTVSGGYRYHYFTQDDEHGLISPFWGFFVHNAKSKNKIEDTKTKKKHTLEIEMFTIGVHWGQRFAWGESFNYTWRIGYGYPVTLNFKWPDGKPNGAKTIEGVTRVLGGLDSELSVGIVF